MSSNEVRVSTDVTSTKNKHDFEENDDDDYREFQAQFSSDNEKDGNENDKQLETINDLETDNPEFIESGIVIQAEATIASASNGKSDVKEPNDSSISNNSTTSEKNTQNIKDEASKEDAISILARELDLQEDLYKKVDAMKEKLQIRNDIQKQTDSKDQEAKNTHSNKKIKLDENEGQKLDSENSSSEDDSDIDETLDVLWRKRGI